MSNIRESRPQHLVLPHEVLSEAGQGGVVGVPVVVDHGVDSSVVKYPLLDLCLNLDRHGLQVSLPPLHLLLQGGLQLLDPLLLDLVLLTQLVDLSALLVEDLSESLHLLSLHTSGQVQLDPLEQVQSSHLFITLVHKLGEDIKYVLIVTSPVVNSLSQVGLDKSSHYKFIED